ncbi:MAG: MBL fold metallo-hydrolase [Candidatus Omnitrophota bacterium]
MAERVNPVKNKIFNGANENFIKFLGTAGARFVTIKQLRASGGIWLSFKGTNLIIDPGPGAIVRCNSARPKLDPCSLSAIVLTHKHLDHSGDTNIMIEAMTEGRFKKKGVLFAPVDALEDKIVLDYLKDSLEKITVLKKGKFSIGSIQFQAPIKNLHSAPTYGLKFYLDKEVVSFVSDSKFFKGLIPAYKDSTILVLNVAFYQKREEFDHLCLEDAIKIVKEIKPRKAILTHFGMSMLRAKPHILEQKTRKELNMDIKFAYDGYTLQL